MANIDKGHIHKAEIHLPDGQWIDVTGYIESFALEDGAIKDVPFGQKINFLSEDGRIFLTIELIDPREEANKDE